MIATETTEDTEGKYSVLSVYSVAENKEKIIFDNRTQMNADNQDFKFNFGTKPEVKRKAFGNLRK